MAAGSTRTPLGFEFTETMGGHISPSAVDCRAAARRRDREPFRFVVTIRTPDLGRFVHDPEHEAVMTGTIRWPRLGGDAEIDEGRFNLFRRDEDGRRQMRYLLRFRAADGTPYRLEGFKDVHRDGLFDAWPDTTRLFTTVTRDEPGGETIARGMLRIRALDLVPQVLSMHAPGTRNPVRQAAALGRFGFFFSSEMLREYGPVWRRPAAVPQAPPTDAGIGDPGSAP